MKSLVSIVATLLGSRATRINLVALGKIVLGLVLMIAAYSAVFHWLMEREGREYSWVTGVYWTMTVMTTLGFGDITFHSDAGKTFSILVMLSGVMYLLVLLPFTFIEFFYAPWMKAQENAKAPRQVPPRTRDHVILTHYGPVERHLVRLLVENGYPYFVLVPGVEEALALRHDEIRVVVGDPLQPATFERLGVATAAMVVSTLDDISNTNVTFTVRELNETVPIVASATRDQLVDALELAGATRILRLEEMLGAALARRVTGNDGGAHVIGELEGLVIAEASPGRTELAGRTLADSDLRGRSGVTVVGLWQRGQCVPLGPETPITADTVLILAGTAAQIDRYNARFTCRDCAVHRVVIIGGGRVGRVVARRLTEAGVAWSLVERHAERVASLPPERVVLGDAADFDTLVRAGLHDADSCIITSHEDQTNIFLTIFIRRLRARMQIISRCTDTRQAERLHRAGSDLVLSYASMGANMVFNELSPKDTVLLAEGVNIFSTPIPPVLAGRTLAESSVRDRSGCSIIAVESPDLPGEAAPRAVNPAADLVLPRRGRLVLIGSLEAEKKFFRVFKPETVLPDDPVGG